MTAEVAGPPQIDLVRYGATSGVGVWKDGWYVRVTWASGRTWHPFEGWATEWAAGRAARFLVRSLARA